MRCLYESDNYVVIYLPFKRDGSLPDDREHAVDPTACVGFEIVDQRTDRSVYLTSDHAAAFHGHIVAWQAATPTQQEVEDTLESFVQLGLQPIVSH